MIVRDELPDKWCIKTYKDEKGKIIGEWFDKQSKNICYHESCLGEYYHSYNCINQSIMYAGDLPASFADYSIREGYTEITFEQFKKYVLKEPITQNKLELTEFPNEGFCKTDSIELRNYLKNKFPQLIQKPWDNKYSIIAWNNTGYWWCAENSSKPEYLLKELLPFIKMNTIQELPLKIGDKFIIKSRPLTWSSFSGGKCGLYIDFPYTSTIVSIAPCDNYISIFDGTYGWTYYPDLFEKIESENNSNFKIGKWYYGEYPTKWYFKYVEQKGFYVYAYEFISVEGKGYYEKSDLGHLENLKTIREATLEEIQKYLPKGHPDKLYEVTIKNPYSEVFLNHSNGKLDRFNNSIFPTFDEKPLIQMKELQINKNYFQDFKDPYINK